HAGLARRGTVPRPPREGSGRGAPSRARGAGATLRRGLPRQARRHDLPPGLRRGLELGGAPRDLAPDRFRMAIQRRLPRRRLAPPVGALLALMTLGACAGGAAGVPDTCLLPAQRTVLIAELFFGRDVQGQRLVTEAEWSDFVAANVAPQFPDGFTVLDA